MLEQEPVQSDELLRIRRFGGGGELVADGLGLASAFFRSDPSSIGVGAYDELAGRTTPDRIETADIEALNRTMRARTPHGAWAELAGGSLPWLESLPSDLDLIELDDDEWGRRAGRQLTREALLAVVGKGRGVSVGTKMLHLKRPRLFPVLDQLVAEVLGARISPDAPAATRADQAAALVLHIRQEGRRNMPELRRIQAALATEGFARSLVRILDAVLWLSHPATSLPGVTREFGSAVMRGPA